MPPQTRALMTSSSASDRRANDRRVPVRLLTALNEMLSVPKKFCSVCTIALVGQPCAEGWSGNAGVERGGPICCVAGSESDLASGVQRSDLVAHDTTALRACQDPALRPR